MSEVSDHQTSDEAVQPLPECFDSDLSYDEEFWGFPLEAVLNDIQSEVVFDYQLNDRGKELFSGGESSNVNLEQDFMGFTLEDL